MKSLLAPPAIMVSVALGAAGCGGVARRTDDEATRSPSGAGGSSSALAASTQSERRRDKNDNDGDAGAFYDDVIVTRYGHAARAAEARSVRDLVKRYYAVAATGDGVKACAMLEPAVAAHAFEDLGRAPGPAYLRGAKTCPALMAKLFRHYRVRLAAKAATLEVRGVRVSAAHGLALLSFGRMPERVISVQRVHRRWRIGMVLDDELP
jgi:hypothetical protein